MTMERSTIFFWENDHNFDWAIFQIANCERHYQRVMSKGPDGSMTGKIATGPLVTKAVVDILPPEADSTVQSMVA